MSDSIDYGNLMHDAMRGLIRRVLEQVQQQGLPGEHHFFITFDTRQEGVELADWLRDRFPETMTIVMQHWFDGLDVGDRGFHVTLNFNDTPEPMFIPYDAIRTFVDPSVEFGLKFETQDAPAPAPAAEKPAPAASPAKDAGAQAGEAGKGNDDAGKDKADKADKGAAEVVSLDAFRK